MKALTVIPRASSMDLNTGVRWMTLIFFSTFRTIARALSAFGMLTLLEFAVTAQTFLTFTNRPLIQITPETPPETRNAYKLLSESPGSLPSYIQSLIDADNLIAYDLILNFANGWSLGPRKNHEHPRISFGWFRGDLKAAKRVEQYDLEPTIRNLS